MSLLDISQWHYVQYFLIDVVWCHSGLIYQTDLLFWWMMMSSIRSHRKGEIDLVYQYPPILYAWSNQDFFLIYGANSWLSVSPQAFCFLISGFFPDISVIFLKIFGSEFDIHRDWCVISIRLTFDISAPFHFRCTMHKPMREVPSASTRALGVSEVHPRDGIERWRPLEGPLESLPSCGSPRECWQQPIQTSDWRETTALAPIPD